MARFLVHFLSLSLLFFLKISTSHPTESCSQTPHPQVCTSMLSSSLSNLQSVQFKSSSSFRDAVIKATLDRAVVTQTVASMMNLGSLDPQAQAAWSDCLELYQDIIQQLNQSVTASSSHDDTQTWLSAAIANQQTCRDGFMELNLLPVYHLSPFSANNMSESISNTLAVNKAMAAPASVGTHRRLLSGRLPEWVSTADRKLLQSPTVKANVVVAQDGSGHYRTIKGAVEASTTLRNGSTSRFVIHIKAGTYGEVVEVRYSMKNIMIIGDGIDRTVVTGNKNVQDGSTILKSATFSKQFLFMHDLFVVIAS